MRPSHRIDSDDETVDEPLINLTPLIDVVFVVLITFMIIAPILDVDHVELAPGSSHHAEQPPRAESPTSITITVRADNSIWVNRHRIQLADLERWLQQERRNHPRAIPKLIHDQKASFGTYQSIKNRLEACGFQEMDVVLEPR